MNAASFNNDLAGARQGAMSGLCELQQLSCQGIDASLVHLSSFQVRRSDELQLIGRTGACLTKELSDSTKDLVAA